MLGIIAGLAVSIVGFIRIRAFESALYRACDAQGDAVITQISEKRWEKKVQNKIKEGKES